MLLNYCCLPHQKIAVPQLQVKWQQHTLSWEKALPLCSWIIRIYCYLHWNPVGWSSYVVTYCPRSIVPTQCTAWATSSLRDILLLRHNNFSLSVIDCCGFCLFFLEIMKTSCMWAPPLYLYLDCRLMWHYEHETLGRTAARESLNYIQTELWIITDLANDFMLWKF